MNIYTYDITTDITSAKVSLDRLTDEITVSIAIPLISLGLNDNELLIEFASDLDSSTKISLDAIILAHSGEPYLEEVVPQSVSIIGQTEVPPFNSKTLPTGQKLFTRIYGDKHTFPAKTSADEVQYFEFVVPLAHSKIDGIEILGGKLGDSTDFIVLDSNIGLVQLNSGIPAESIIPNLQLNQFGFNKYIKPDYYMYTSKYDADLYQDMVLKIGYRRDDMESRDIYFNVFLHEVVTEEES
jgi:hypothetical protein